eukprot:10240712-Alexandrium_andersonii.AAC.1
MPTAASGSSPPSSLQPCVFGRCASRSDSCWVRSCSGRPCFPGVGQPSEAPAPNDSQGSRTVDEE